MKNSLSLSLLLACVCISSISYSQLEQVEVYLDSSRHYSNNRTKADSFAKIALDIAIEQKDDKSQFESLKFLARLSDRYYDLENSYNYYEQALSVALNLDQTKDVIESYIYMSMLKEDLGVRQEAITLVNKAINLAEETNDSLNIGKSIRYLGVIKNNEGNHDKAMEYYLKASEYVEQFKDHYIYGRTSQGIGIIYNKQKDFDKAEIYFNKAYSHFVGMKDTSGIIAVMNDFGILNKNKGNYNESEQWYLKMLDLSMHGTHSWVKPIAYANLGILYYNMEEYEKGISYCEQANEINRVSGKKRSESDALNTIAKCQLALGQNQEAIKNSKRSVTLAKEAQVLEKERDALLTLSSAFEKTNQTKLALQYFKEHKTVYDSIYSLEKSEQIHGLEEKYQKAQKDREIAIMQKNSELEKVKNTRLWIVLGLTLFFSGFLLLFQIQKRRKEKLILEEKQKVSHLENQKLSQELDFKNQQLTSKVLQLCRKNEFLQTVNKDLKEINTEITGEEKNKIEKLSAQISRDMQSDEDWQQFLSLFESVHPNFNNKLSELHSDFSKGEIRLASLLKMNLSTKDISSLLNVTVAAVKKTRNRMRKKMDISSSTDLTSYFLALGN